MCYWVTTVKVTSVQCVTTIARITYTVLVVTLNHAQSINQCVTDWRQSVSHLFNDDSQCHTCSTWYWVTTVIASNHLVFSCRAADTALSRVDTALSRVACDSHSASRRLISLDVCLSVTESDITSGCEDCFIGREDVCLDDNKPPARRKERHVLWTRSVTDHSSLLHGTTYLWSWIGLIPANTVYRVPTFTGKIQDLSWLSRTTWEIFQDLFGAQECLNVKKKQLLLTTFGV